MKISARNQLKGTVAAITRGAVNGVVTIDLGSTVIKAGITLEAIEALGLVEGSEAYAIIKATNVLIAAGSEPIVGISARNQLVGTVVAVKEDAVNGHVTLELAGGARVMASITNEAIESLGITTGTPAIAIIKVTDVIVGVD